MTKKKASHYPIYLAYLGTLPLLVCALLSLFNVKFVPMFADVIQVSVIYSLIICSFMAGTHWGIFLDKMTLKRTYLLWSSNLQAILLWVLFLFVSLENMLWVTMISFILLLFIDYQLKQAKEISTTYFQMRGRVTSIVLICLLIIASPHLA